MQKTSLEDRVLRTTVPNAESDTWFVGRSYEKCINNEMHEIMRFIKMMHLPDNSENKYDWGYFLKGRQ